MIRTTLMIIRMCSLETVRYADTIWRDLRCWTWESRFYVQSVGPDFSSQQKHRLNCRHQQATLTWFWLCLLIWRGCHGLAESSHLFVGGTLCSHQLFLELPMIARYFTNGFVCTSSSPTYIGKIVLLFFSVSTTWVRPSSIQLITDFMTIFSLSWARSKVLLKTTLQCHQHTQPSRSDLASQQAVVWHVPEIGSKNWTLSGSGSNRGAMRAI